MPLGGAVNKKPGEACAIGKRGVAGKGQCVDMSGPVPT